MKKILFVNTLNTADERGGQEKYISMLYEVFTEAGIKCSIAAPASICASADEILISKSKYSFFKTLKQLNGFLKNYGANLVISNDCYSNLLCFILRIFNKNIVYASVIHDIYISKFMPSGLLCRKFIYYLIDRFVVKFFDFELFYSPYLYKKSKSERAVFNGAYLNFPAEKLIARKNESKKTVGWIGRPDIVKKGLDVFFEIARDKELNKKYDFVAAGIDENNAHIKKKTGVSENIRFSGYLDNPAEFYNNVDIVVIPSRYESLGFVLLEAVYFQKPVIVSDIPAFSEILNSIDYKINAVKVGDVKTFIGRLSELSISDDELVRCSMIIKEKYSYELFKKNSLNFINNVVSLKNIN